MKVEFSDQFLEKLALVTARDDVYGEYIRRECEFFAAGCSPASVVFDVHEITVEDIGGRLIARIIAISNHRRIVFFDLEEPEKIDDDS